MYYGIPVWASHEWLFYHLYIYLDIRWNCGINFTSRSSRGITLEYIEELWKHLCKQTACGYPWHTSCFWLWGKTHELKCVKNEFICKCILIIKLFATAQAIFIRLVNLKSYMDQQDLISIMITRFWIKDASSHVNEDLLVSSLGLGYSQTVHNSWTA
jgi:hypothetical protein